MSLTIPQAQEDLHVYSHRIVSSLQRNGHRWKGISAEVGGLPYRDALPGEDEPVMIPDPSIFDGLEETTADDDGDPLRIPSTAECAVHLELLHAFSRLRKQVVESVELDRVLHIEPKPRTVWRRYGRKRRQVKLRDESFAGRRAKKWPFYLRLAVQRFFLWLEKMEGHDSIRDGGTELPFCPPLDVLMAWHSALLNSSWFEYYCRISGISKMRAVVFPWSRIHQAINPSDWSFKLPTNDAAKFEKLTGLDSDTLTYLIVDPKPSAFSDLFGRMGITPRPYFQSEIDQMLEALTPTLSPKHKAFLECWLHSMGVKVDNTQLADAVERQALFMEKMAKHLWLRSPAVRGTLTRAVDRYAKFLKLFKLYPGTMLVPTLDIDLVWHTHQCSLEVYEKATRALTGRVIDHDGKLGAGTLDNGMEKTRNLFRIRFGMDYEVCLCWDCEAIRSAMVDGKFDQLTDEGCASDFDAVAKELAHEVTYYRVVEQARRNQKRLPIRTW